MRWIIGLMGLTLGVNGLAQQDDSEVDWLREQQQSFEQFSSQNQLHYQQFLSEADREFALWLAQAWPEFEALAPRQRDSKPKPTQPPQLEEAAPAKQAAPVSLSQSTFSGAHFYGHPAELPAWPAPLPQLADLKPETLAMGWLSLAQVNYTPVLASLTGQCEGWACGDWALLQWLGKFAGEQRASPNTRVLLHAFLAHKAGLAVRVGRVNGQLQLLFASQQAIYGRVYYDLDGRFWFPFKPDTQGRLHSYPPGGAADNNLALDFRFQRTLAASAERKSRRFIMAGSEVSLSYNPGRVRFLDSLPQLDLALYFAAPLPAYLADQLAADEVPSDKATLLALVQKAVPYQTDHQQFGRENTLLPEQLLHYPAADCEDRSLFYAALVRARTGEPVLGLRYPGHVATLVVPVGESHGQTYAYQQKRWQLADPTYIGAPLGKEMPDLTGQGEVIVPAI